MAVDVDRTQEDIDQDDRLDILEATVQAWDRDFKRTVWRDKVTALEQDVADIHERLAALEAKVQ